MKDSSEIKFDGPTVRALIEEYRENQPILYPYRAHQNYREIMVKRLAAGLVSALNDECWVWTKSRVTDGYGNVMMNRRHTSAHRIAFQLGKGDIPAGLFVCHSCDNPPCINPAHLHIGTNADNLRECRDRGRHKSHIMPGEANPIAKLDNTAVNEIRELLRMGLSHRKIAALFGICPQNVSKIKNGERWAHLLDPKVRVI